MFCGAARWVSARRSEAGGCYGNWTTRLENEDIKKKNEKGRGIGHLVSKTRSSIYRTGPEEYLEH